MVIYYGQRLQYGNEGERVITDVGKSRSELEAIQSESRKAGYPYDIAEAQSEAEIYEGKKISEYVSPSTDIPKSQQGTVTYDSQTGTPTIVGGYGLKTEEEIAQANKAIQFEQNLAKARQEGKISPSSAEDLKKNFYVQLSQTTNQLSVGEKTERVNVLSASLSTTPQQSQLQLQGSYTPYQYADAMMRQGKVKSIDYVPPDKLQGRYGGYTYYEYPHRIQVSTQFPDISREEASRIGQPYATRESILGHELIHATNPNLNETEVVRLQREYTDSGRWFPTTFGVNLRGDSKAEDIFRQIPLEFRTPENLRKSAEESIRLRDGLQEKTTSIKTPLGAISGDFETETTTKEDLIPRGARTLVDLEQLKFIKDGESQYVPYKLGKEARKDVEEFKFKIQQQKLAESELLFYEEREREFLKAIGLTGGKGNEISGVLRESVIALSPQVALGSAASIGERQRLIKEAKGKPELSPLIESEKLRTFTKENLKEMFNPKTEQGQANILLGALGGYRLIKGGVNIARKVPISEFSATYPTTSKIGDIIISKTKIPQTYSSFEMMYSKTGGFPVDKSFKFEPIPYVKEPKPLFEKSPIAELRQDEFGSYARIKTQDYPQYNLYGQPISKTELQLSKQTPLKQLPESSKELVSRPTPQKQLIQDVITSKKGLTYEPIVETTPLYSEFKGYEIKYEDVPYKTEPRLTIPRRYILKQEPRITLAEGYGIREPQPTLTDLGFVEPLTKPQKTKIAKLPQSDIPFERKPSSITSFTTSFDKPQPLPEGHIYSWMKYGEKEIPRLDEQYAPFIEAVNEPSGTIFDVDITQGKFRGKGKYIPPEERIITQESKIFLEPSSRVKPRTIPTRITTQRQKDKAIQIQSPDLEKELLPKGELFPISRIKPIQQPTPIQELKTPQITIPQQKQFPLQKPIQEQFVMQEPALDLKLTPPLEIPRFKPPEDIFEQRKPPTGVPFVWLPKGKPSDEFDFSKLQKTKRRSGYTSSLIAEEFGIVSKKTYKELAKQTYSGIGIRPLIKGFSKPKGTSKTKSIFRRKRK